MGSCIHPTPYKSPPKTAKKDKHCRPPLSFAIDTEKLVWLVSRNPRLRLFCRLLPLLPLVTARIITPLIFFFFMRASGIALSRTHLTATPPPLSFLFLKGPCGGSSLPHPRDLPYHPVVKGA